MRVRSHTGSSGLLGDFARDIAARLQRAVPARPTRANSAAGGPRGRRVANASGGASLEGIADRLLGMKLSNPMEAIEIALLSQAMTTAEGNITAASRILGIHRKAVERLVTKHKVRRGDRAKAQTRARPNARRTRRAKSRR